VFSALIGAKGRDVLYCGDHIYGDILKSKKIRGWRTFLTVPEMTHELYVWSARRDLHQRMHTLEARLNDAYLYMDSSSTTAPDTKNIQDEIQVCEPTKNAHSEVFRVLKHARYKVKNTRDHVSINQSINQNEYSVKSRVRIGGA